MPFLKLDTDITKSSIWYDKDARDCFLAALLMAKPHTLKEPAPALNIRDLDGSGFTVPPGDYGFVSAAGVGIIQTAGIEREAGLDALERLAAPDPDSRNPDWEGRRLVRVNHGFIALNFDHYRWKDHTTAARSKRWREREAAKTKALAGERAKMRDEVIAELRANGDTAC